MNNLKVVDTTLTIFSSMYSLATIEQTLSIIILCINIAWILFRASVSIYDKWKKKDLKGIEEEVTTTIDDLEALKGKKEDEDGKR